MKLLVRKPLTYRGVHYRPGQVATVDLPRLALQLVRTGYAIAVEEPPKPDEVVAEEQPSGVRKRRRRKKAVS